MSNHTIFIEYSYIKLPVDLSLKSNINLIIYISYKSICIRIKFHISKKVY